MRSPRRVLIAPDSFKGTLSAGEAADAMRRGLLRALPGAVTELIPVSDGGEGFLDVLVPRLGGEFRTADVSGPLPGQRVTGRWGATQKLAIVESAAASGLMLIPEGKRDPRVTTTFGVGELIRSGLDAGLRRFLIGIGGTGTNDGGAGLARALGVRFLDRSGKVLPP
ncbi:MAG TPA: glycerate kinase, partial [Bacteroidota bacterium]|nr:glycerate kinase [Bacteroidota bacterium]